MSDVDKSGDSRELEELFDSIAAGIAAMPAPPAELPGYGRETQGVSDSDEQIGRAHV